MRIPLRLADESTARPPSRTARMCQFPPRFKDTVDRIEDLGAAVGLLVEDLHPDLPAQVAWTGIDVLVVPVRDAGAVSRAAPSPAKLTALVGSVGTDGLYLAALEGDGVHARFFTWGAVVDEDAATGSAAGPCAAYFVERQ